MANYEKQLTSVIDSQVNVRAEDITVGLPVHTCGVLSNKYVMVIVLVFKLLNK